MEHPELVGVYEIAEMAGVSRTVVSNWRVRDPRFPEPEAELRSGPVYRADQIERYLKRRSKLALRFRAGERAVM